MFQTVKTLPASAGSTGWIPGSGESPGEGNSTPLQYSCLGNLMDRGVWRAAVHGVVSLATEKQHTDFIKFLVIPLSHIHNITLCFQRLDIGI